MISNVTTVKRELEKIRINWGVDLYSLFSNKELEYITSPGKSIVKGGIPFLRIDSSEPELLLFDIEQSLPEAAMLAFMLRVDVLSVRTNGVVHLTFSCARVEGRNDKGVLECIPHEIASNKPCLKNELRSLVYSNAMRTTSQDLFFDFRYDDSSFIPDETKRKQLHKALAVTRMSLENDLRNK